MANDNVATWRKTRRQELIERRMALSSSERSQLTPPALANLARVLDGLAIRTLGIYWPFRREIDIRPLADVLSQERDFEVALPVVVEKATPLAYWRWRLGEQTEPGVWNIPVPAKRAPVQPDVVVAPLVGFKDAYRLGYGGGYFDRTLAAATPRPFAIGLGFEICRLETFAPLAHDIPMDAIVTEAGIVYRDAERTSNGRSA